ncbi:MAG: alpha/beta hydrolase [Smithella sp.]
MIKIIDIDNIKIACWLNPAEFGGQQQNLVFVHGSGGEHTSWVYQYSRLHQQFNIVAVDLPGHGLSKGDGESDVDRYCLWIKKLLDVLQLAKPFLVGHSLGAAIVMKFAVLYPQDIIGIVPVGGGLKLPVNPNWLAGLKTDPALTVELACKYSLAEENRPRFFEALKKSLAKARMDVFFGDLTACDNFDLTADVGKIDAPTLVVCGMEDQMTPASFSRRIAASISGAKLCLIEGAGHMVMLEKPAEFNAVLSEFASKLTSE